MRRHYANWPYIISTSALGKTPSRFVLRDGRVLEFTEAEKRFEFANFARLLDAGWRVEDVDDIHMTMKKDVMMKIRYREPPEHIQHERGLFGPGVLLRLRGKGRS